MYVSLDMEQSSQCLWSYPMITSSIISRYKYIRLMIKIPYFMHKTIQFCKKWIQSIPSPKTTNYLIQTKFYSNNYYKSSNCFLNDLTHDSVEKNHYLLSLKCQNWVMFANQSNCILTFNSNLIHLLMTAIHSNYGSLWLNSIQFKSNEIK